MESLVEEVEVISVGPQEDVDFAVEVVEEVAVPGLKEAMEESCHRVEVAELRVKLGEVTEERDDAVQDSVRLKVEVMELRMRMREVREEVQEKDKRIRSLEERVAAVGVERVAMVQEMQDKSTSGVAALHRALRLLQDKEREVQRLRRKVDLTTQEGEGRSLTGTKLPKEILTTEEARVESKRQASGGSKGRLQEQGEGGDILTPVSVEEGARKELREGSHGRQQREGEVMSKGMDEKRQKKVVREAAMLQDHLSTYFTPLESPEGKRRRRGPERLEVNSTKNRDSAGNPSTKETASTCTTATTSIPATTSTTQYEVADSAMEQGSRPGGGVEVRKDKTEPEETGEAKIVVMKKEVVAQMEAITVKREISKD